MLAARSNAICNMTHIDSILSRLTALHPKRIDLSLGREVPVRLQLAPTAPEIARGRKAPAGPVLPSRFVLPTQSKSKREL